MKKAEPPEFTGSFTGLLVIFLVAVLTLMGRDICRRGVVVSSGPNKVMREKTVVSAEEKPFVFWAQMFL